MMRQIWYWGFLAAVACALASCVKEKLDYRVTEVEEGLPATVTLKYGVVHNEVVTRAAQQEEYEYRVGNLYVFIFDGQGNKHEGKFFTPGEGLVTDAAARNGSVSFETTTLNHATIVGIANVTIAGQVETAYTITESDLNN